MSLTPEKWQQVKALFEAALEREPRERGAFLDRAANGDDELLNEVASLLDFDGRAAAFIEAPAAVAVPELFADTQIEPIEGRRIGPYEILKEIGHGGMGAVYLAERADEQYEKKVAIKLVKQGFDNAFIVQRFLGERQILANLDHPNIARLLDGGATRDGSPYLVMEFVDGSPISQYCDSHQLSIAERLKLFRTVCAAVAHAHRNLVIHRDLKPSNVLVTEEGILKLLDFGIAKIFSAEESAQRSDQTATALRLMTPGYASPEQVRGENIATSSDIYSLGVLLYKLLTGHHPYRFAKNLPQEIERVVCEQDPERPSTVVSRTEEGPSTNGSTAVTITPDAVSTNRHTQPEKLRRLLHGDLDNIVLMAMRKEATRRYSSVDRFSEDIRRHLEGLPVSARADTLAYRSSKFVQRHRAGVAAAALVLFVMIAGTVATAWQARVARRERDKAQRVSTFLQDMLGAAAPDIRGVDIKVTDVLGEASRRAKAELADQPEAMADVLLTLGRTYISLQMYSSAESDLRAALGASLKANGQMHPTTATSMTWLGLALAYQNQVAEGEQISRRAVELQRKLHPEGHEDLGVALYSLGTNLITLGEAKAAEPLLQEAVVMIRKHLGEKHGYHLAALGMLGWEREGAGDLDGAESLYRQAIAVGHGVEYRYRIFLAQALSYLGVLLINKKNYSEAESVLHESEAIYREQSGDSNASIGVVKLSLGRMYFFQGNYAKAEVEFQQALDLLRKYFPREHPFTITSAAGLGLALTRAGKPVEGELFLREALEIRKKVLPQGDVQISNTESALGECLTVQKRYAEAESLLLHGYEGLKTKAGEQDPRTSDARTQLIKLYEAWRKPGEADHFR